MTTATAPIPTYAMPGLITHEQQQHVDAIQRFLEILHPKAGDAFEIRALKCRAGAFSDYRATASGYYNDPEQAAKDAAELDWQHDPSGIYVTLNPVQSDLLARSCNNTNHGAKHTTADAEITRRRWLLIDLDPDRPGGISATEGEMIAALEIASHIQQQLGEAGWPEPLSGMSGNGAYLIYRIDQPNDEEATGLVKNVLAALAGRFDNDQVKVDTTTYNAARLCKVLGTTARKGDDLQGQEGVEDRPHRVSWFRMPAGPLEPVSREMLETLVGEAGSPGEAGSMDKSISPPGADNTGRCIAYIEKCPDAVSGQGGHNTTFAAACTCYKFGLSPEQALQVMGWYNEHKTGGEPWTEAELQHKLADAENAVREAGEFGCMLPPGTGVKGSIAVAAELTDVGNAARLVNRHGHELRLCTAKRKWHRWNGTRWECDDSGQIILMAKDTALSIYDEAKEAPNEERRKALTDHAVRSQHRARIDAMVALAEPELPVNASQWDSDGMLLNCVNGTLDLRTGELKSHDQADYITMLAPVAYRPDASAPRFEQFIAEITGNDAALACYIQRLLGMCLTGDIGEEFLPLFFGDGCNGKSKLMETVMAVMGDYATTASSDLIATKKDSELHPTAVAGLAGKRLVIASETELGDKLRLSLIKRLTGNVIMKARFMHRDFFEFIRTFKLIVETNHLPAVDESTEAVRRRLRVVPFNVVIPEDRRDTGLSQKLLAESEGILAWLVRGCLEWQRHGLGEPAAVRNASTEFFGEMDEMGQFLDDCCIFVRDGWATSGELRKRYNKWCKCEGIEPLSADHLYAALKRRRCESGKRAGQRVWHHVVVSETWTPWTPRTGF